MKNEMMIATGAILATILGLIIKEQVSHQMKRKKLPGPSFTLPFLGGIIEMVLDPASFWIRQDNYGPLSYNSLIGRFMVHSAATETSRKILAADEPGVMKMALHPNAEMILGSNNIAFMQGTVHKELRNQLLPLFTRKALGLYLSIQERFIRLKIEEWVASGKEHEFRNCARDLNITTSNHVFAGPYLSPTQMQKFSEDYQLMNNGFLSFPVNLPGTALNTAIKARKRIVNTLVNVVKASKEKMSKGEEPSCLVDFWMEKMVKLIEEAKANNTPLPTHHDDYEIACVVLDFLFASQDASTSSLVWTITLLAENPDVMEKVREEQKRLRPNDEPITHELLVSMTYTRQVVKEILRFKPPATLVPQETLVDYQLTDDVVVPKGSLLTPSLWASSYQGFSDPLKFDPERFNQERDEGTKYAKNFLVFGHGPHSCMGKEYAINNLMAFAALLATHVSWKRRHTKKSNHITFGPTIYPGDCLVTFSKI